MHRCPVLRVLLVIRVRLYSGLGTYRTGGYYASLPGTFPTVATAMEAAAAHAREHGVIGNVYECEDAGNPQGALLGTWGCAAMRVTL